MRGISVLPLRGEPKDAHLRGPGGGPLASESADPRPPRQEAQVASPVKGED